METLIEYRDVGVDGDDGPIVAGFSATIPAGRLTVIVGPSGAGKTTLLRLLNRLDDPDDGAVLLAGHDLRSYPVLDLRRRVQVVGQVPVTFPGTVAANIAGEDTGTDVAGLLERVGLDPCTGHQGGRPALGGGGAADVPGPVAGPRPRSPGAGRADLGPRHRQQGGDRSADPPAGRLGSHGGDGDPRPGARRTRRPRRRRWNHGGALRRRRRDRRRVGVGLRRTGQLR